MKISQIINLKKPGKYQKKLFGLWTSVGRARGTSMTTYHTLSAGFLPKPAWRGWARTKTGQQRQPFLVLLLSCLLQVSWDCSSRKESRQTLTWGATSACCRTRQVSQIKQLFVHQQCHNQSTFSELGRTICWATVPKWKPVSRHRSKLNRA